MDALEHLLAFLVMFVGSAIQGSVGFGANLFAAPLLVLISPELVPGPAIVATSCLNLLVIRRERAPHVWTEMKWPTIGQVPGAIAGAAILSLIAADNLAIFFSLLILLAVALSVSGLHPKKTKPNLTIAGFAAAFMGTAVGIGGPPIALFYQRSSGPEIRAALSRFFAIGSALSIVMLIAFGQFTWTDLGNGLLLLPGTVAGYLLSSRVMHHINGAHVRIGVLTLSAASAIVALVRALT